MAEFVAIESDVTAADLEQEVKEALEAAFEGLTFPEGDLLDWLIKIFSRLGQEVTEQASALSKAAFKRFGEAVVSVPPVQAAPASVTSVWTMIDASGYTIPAGTQVAIEASGDESIGFETTEEVTIPPESTKAEVPLQAIEPGEDGNGLTADPQLIDALSYVSSITLEGETTSGGVDEEEEDDYLDRLVETLRLLSLSLIVADDFEIDARAVSGIARCKAIEAYNAEAEEEEALAVSVFPIDENGEALSEAVKEELAERQQAKIPSGTVLYVADPTYTEIDVTATVTIQSGFDPATVLAAVQERLEAYLDPANWGTPSQGDESGSGWDNRTTVYYFELVSEIDRVAGVDRVASLKVAKHEEALGEADVELPGKVPLTQPGTLSVEEA